ncbi:hypothetical protein [Nocardiopsis sp. NPDC058789]|uniref:hypothetical protein n=1 Tax=Nocardiopsis sp. NPDC058789 TaxID=3346634 RepID=UPI00366A68B7
MNPPSADHPAPWNPCPPEECRIRHVRPALGALLRSLGTSGELPTRTHELAALYRQELRNAADARGGPVLVGGRDPELRLLIGALLDQCLAD